MLKFKIFLFIQFLVFCVDAQNPRSLQDSISKYLSLNPQKGIEFGFEAISSNHETNSDLYRTNYLFGQNLYLLGLYEESVKYLIKSQELYSSLSDSDQKKYQVDYPWMLNTIGNIYYRKNNPSTAKDYYNKAYRIFFSLDDEIGEEKIYGLNGVETNLALLSSEEKDYNQTLNYYNSILNRRKDFQKKSDILLSYTQFMGFYLEVGNDEKAEKYLDLITNLFLSDPTNLELQNNSELKQNYCTAMIVYSAHLIAENNLNKALQTLNELKPLTRFFQTEYHDVNYLLAKIYNSSNYDNNHSITLIKENLALESISNERKLLDFNLLLEIHKAENDYKSLSSIKDSIIHYNYKKLESLSKIDNIENLITLNNKERELNKNKLRFNRTLLSFGGITILLIFGLILLRFNLKLQREKNKVLELEKLQVESELNLKKRELFSKTNYILQRNDYLKSLLDQVNKAEKIEDLSKRIKNQISAMLSSNKQYEEFDKKFVEVFPHFYKELNSRYSLSKTDFRLVAYIKMNKSNNEIAQISGISLRTVQSQRYRLAKKLNLSKDQDLNSFIFNI